MNFGGRNNQKLIQQSCNIDSARGGDRKGQPTPVRLEREKEDLALLRAHVAGDSRAFGMLVARHRAMLLNVARRHCDAPLDPNDCVQEGLLRAMNAARGFRGNCSVATWLSLIVKHACMDYYRGRFGQAPVCEDEETFARKIDSLSTEKNDVALRIVMSDALAKLPKDQRDALLYLDIFGYSITETASSTGQPSGTLKSRRARARTFLRRRLGDVLAA